MQSPVVREHAGIAEDQVIMICVAMGYPDDSFPANAVVLAAQIRGRSRGVRRLRRLGRGKRAPRQPAKINLAGYRDFPRYIL